MPKTVHHVVERPGRKPGEPGVEIPVADDLVSVPGSPVREEDVSFFSREHPLENQTIEHAADREWAWTVYTDEVYQYRKGHDERMKPVVKAAASSGDVEPTAEPEPGVDVTEKLRRRAAELGFGEVGFTRYDRRYTYASKKHWVKYEHAICLAYEQDYAQTQAIPSLEAEYAHFGTYEINSAAALKLAEYIRSQGYHAQIHGAYDNSAPFIPMFVSAGLGQLGANGQLLSPYFGSAARLLIITTDALVTYDEPVDYGINNFCQKCQVCVNRCPGRALVKDKVWWRGVEKNKLVYERCRPVMATYEGCAVCMKVCPVQRYGMKPVMEHYVATGEVLGKGTDNLEGYTLRDKGYFGPGELPHFDRDLFEFPHGRKEDWLFEQFKQRLLEEGAPPEGEAVEFASKVKKVLDEGRASAVEE